MPHCYILKTTNGSYYIGSTLDIEKRLDRHNKGCVLSTKHKLPVKLVFKEYYKTKADAQKKEYKIKRWKNNNLIKKLIAQGPIV